MSTLKQVLEVFKDTSQPLTMNQIARQLSLEPPVLEDMIAFWVRKGRLRDVSACDDTCNCGTACSSCSFGATGCPFVVQMPKRYEFVEPDETH